MIPFASRESAAHELAKRLAHLRGQRPLILAVPRGAVPMAAIVAAALDGEVDVVLVHKLGAPGNPELAIGAVDEGGEITLDDYGRALPPAYVRDQAARQVAALGERRRRFTPGRGPADCAGRVVVVLDDGVATGATLRAALALVRAQRPRRLVAAAAVAPPDTAAALRAVADEVVLLATPEPFWAVGQFFVDFRQVEDDEVERLLAVPARAPV